MKINIFKNLLIGSTALLLAGTPSAVGTDHAQNQYSYNNFNLERAIKNSQVIIDTTKADMGYSSATGDSKDQESRPEGYGIESFQRLVDDAKSALKSGNAEKIHDTVSELITWQYFYTPYDMPLPPTPLLPSADKIVQPPEGTHPFYQKYMNVYIDDYRHGSPIIASANVPDKAIYKVRETMLKLMKRKDIRMALAANNIRVVLRGANEKNSDHPGFIGPGGAVPGQPTTYIEEEGVYWTHDNGEPHEAFARLRRHVAVEEFGHSVHASALPYIEPERDLMEEINVAFREAVRNGYYDPNPRAGVDLLSHPARAEELAFLLAPEFETEPLPEDMPRGFAPYMRLDFRAAEYFASGLDLMYGIHHEVHEYKLKSVEEMKQKDPKLYKILTDLFEDDGWSPYKTK